MTYQRLGEHGFSITVETREPPPSPAPPVKRPPRAFDLAALLREPMAHPCVRFPMWAILPDGRPWALLDQAIAPILSRTEGPLYRLCIFCHTPTARYLGGTDSLGWGFGAMPAVVSKALRNGEMRTLQQLAGWTDVRFRYPENTIESATGCDGVTLYFDEDGRPSYDKGEDLL